MVTLVDLWMPILVAAVVVFFVSAIIHMVLRYHRTDLGGLPNEDAVMKVLGAGLTPGQYGFPWCSDMKQMQSEEMRKKFQAGPVGIITIRPTGEISMGPLLVKWFFYCILISVLTGYMAEASLDRTVPFMAIFRIAGTAAFLGYSGAVISAGIWLSRPWSTVFKDVVDGAIYALLTGAVFGWLWPR